MNKRTTKKMLVVTALVLTTVLANYSHAGTRQKPPVAGTQSVVWYQPVLDFFNF